MLRYVRVVPLYLTMCMRRICTASAVLVVPLYLPL
eukprot:SAG11_NODE_31762_length_289_cov_1.078947_1_plen_34_part_01